MTMFDRAISAVSPSWALNRQLARSRISALKKASAYYDGADKGRRGASIRRSSADANVVSRKSLPALRSGSHDMVRNNPHARRGVEAIVSNTVGAGIKVQFQKNGNPAEDIHQLAMKHLGSLACDADGRNNFFGLQALVCRAMVEGGEVLVRRRWRRTSDGLPLPVQFQVLEGDFLDHTKEGPTASGGYIMQGVEFDALGRRKGYWIFNSHPNGAVYQGLPSSKFVQASEIIHLYLVERPGQVRGIPWLAPVMLRLQDFSDYEEAQLVRQKIAACYVAFIQDIQDNPTGVPGVPGDGEDADLTGFEPGLITNLPPGRQVTFGQPPTVNDYDPYARVSLRAVAAGLGISYEALTGDLKGVSFTSGRMGRLEMNKNVDAWRWLTLIPVFNDKICGWVLEAIFIAQGIDTAGVTFLHTPPRREMLNPAQEVSANTGAVRSGQKTLTQLLQESGRDPDSHFKELAAEKKTLDDLGLVLDIDPSKVSGAGLAQQVMQDTSSDNAAD